MNTIYIGFNRDHAAVRQRERPQGHRDGHRPQAHRRQLLPGWLRGRDPLHAVRAARPFGCEGDDWYDFDPAAAKELLTEAELRLHQDLPAVVPERRPRLPAGPRRSSRPSIQSQLKDNLGINVSLDLQDSGDLHRRRDRRQADRLFLLRLGRGLSGRHQLPRLPLRLRLRAQVRRRLRRHRGGADQGCDLAGRCGPQGRLHRGEQPHQGERPGGHHRPRRERHSLQGRCPGRRRVAA